MRGGVFRLALPTAQGAVGSDELLRDWGCACVAVESIDEALQAARAYRPALVIADYRLRGHRSGVDAIATLCAEFGKLPALLITGDTGPERLREADASGIPVLHKPVSPSQLYRRVVDVLCVTDCPQVCVDG